MIVLDSSVAVELLLGTPLGLRHAGLLFGQERHAPHLLDVEFTHALRRLTFAGEVEVQRARLALDLLGNITLIRHRHTHLLPRMWELRQSMTAYDAAYVALAEGLEMPLLTCDGKLSRSHGHRAKIQLLQ
jgi:predicted nucleic acid-binding protein